MNTRTITVCLLTYNNAESIDVAIESVLKQTNQQWKMVIADDASHDDTETRVSKYFSDSRITYMRQPENIGQAANWKAAIETADSEIVGTLHADDAWIESTLETVSESYTSNDSLDLLIGNWLVMDSELKTVVKKGPNQSKQLLVGDESFSFISQHNRTLPSATFFKKDLAVSSGFPDSRFPTFCDREFFLRMSRRSTTTEILANVFTEYRTNPEGVSYTTPRSVFYSECHALANEFHRIAKGHPDEAALVELFSRDLALVIYRPIWWGILQRRLNFDDSVKEWTALADELYGTSGFGLKDYTLRTLAKHPMLGRPIYKILTKALGRG